MAATEARRAQRAGQGCGAGAASSGPRTEGDERHRGGDGVRHRVPVHRLGKRGHQHRRHTTGGEHQPAPTARRPQARGGDDVARAQTRPAPTS